MTTTTHRPLHIIAREIRSDFRGKPSWAFAEPYVNAMLSLHDITDNYYEDSAESVVLYALSNLGTWRGETAKRVKAELKAILASNKR